MKFSIDEFRAWNNKKVTLLGMSGVGKTYLSTLLCGHNWFHYSGDYRIGTRYLNEHIIDMIKQQAISAYDPRVIEVTGISMMVTAQGADHTAGNIPAFECAGKSVQEIADASYEIQVNAS